MHMFLQRFLHSHTGPIPNFFARLVDDIFFLWHHLEPTLHELLHTLNNHHYSIKFEMNHSHTNINFLDTIVYVNPNTNTLHTKLYIKPNKATFCRVFGLLRPKVQGMRYWCGHRRYRPGNFLRRYRQTPTKSGPVRSLSCMDEFTLTLMKLRLAVPSDFLANIFAISTCSSILNTWIKFLATELKCLVFWPSKEKVRCYIPQSLHRQYPNLRCTLDCNETFVEQPHDLKLQSVTWSEHKRSAPAKATICII